MVKGDFFIPKLRNRGIKVTDLEIRRNKRRMSKKIKNALTGYSFIAINVIGVVFFWVIPLIFSFVLSISKWDVSQGLAGIKIIGFQNYIDMWKDEWFQASLINNVIFTVVYVILLLVISFFVALFLKEKVIGKKFVQMGMYLPYVVNVVAIAAVFLAIFSREGPVSVFLKFLGMEEPPLFLNDTRFALATVVIICVWQTMGYTAMLFLSGLINIPEDLYEAAAIDGAGWWQKTRNVTIPMLSSTSFFIMVTTIVNSFKVFGLINVMTAGGPGNSTTMLVYNIYRTAFRFNKIEFASAQGIVLLVIIFIISVIQFRIQNKQMEER